MLWISHTGLNSLKLQLLHFFRKIKNFTIFPSFSPCAGSWGKNSELSSTQGVTRNSPQVSTKSPLSPSSSDKKYLFFFCWIYEYSKLEEPVDNLSVDSLISMEEQLETALSVTRDKKVSVLLPSVWTNYPKIFCLVRFRGIVFWHNP